MAAVAFVTQQPIAFLYLLSSRRRFGGALQTSLERVPRPPNSPGNVAPWAAIRFLSQREAPAADPDAGKQRVSREGFGAALRMSIKNVESTVKINHIRRRLRHLARRWRAWRYRRFVVRQVIGGAAYQAGYMAVGVTVAVLWHYLRG